MFVYFSQDIKFSQIYINTSLDCTMKFTTANSKSCDYNRNHVFYVGTQTGTFKSNNWNFNHFSLINILFYYSGLDANDEDKPYRQTNLQSLDTLTKDSRITCMRWSNEEENEILIGRADQTVRIYDCSTNTFEEDLKVDSGSSIVGLGKFNE